MFKYLLLLFCLNTGLNINCSDLKIDAKSKTEAAQRKQELDKATQTEPVQEYCYNVKITTGTYDELLTIQKFVNDILHKSPLGYADIVDDQKLHFKYYSIIYSLTEEEFMNCETILEPLKKLNIRMSIKPRHQHVVQPVL